jgi:fucose 4-O-acetylase-like acetyltransferase
LPREAGSLLRGSGRDFQLDLLRALAIAEVVLAHAALPPWLAQSRNFGVPLLILISGMAFAARYRGETPGLAYVARRIWRVLAPTWLFLTFFFLFAAIVLDLAGAAYPYSASTIAHSYDLSTGIGYVWVIRVNILVAFLTPFIAFASNRTPRAGLFIAGSIAVLIVFALLQSAFGERLAALGSGPLWRLICRDVPYLVPYAVIFAIGLRVEEIGRRGQIGLALGFGAVAAALAWLLYKETGHLVPTQDFKYPPRLYYVAYAMFVSLLLIAGKDRLAALVPGRLRGTVTIVGSNTLWIYLWHILVIELLVEPFFALSHLPDDFVSRWAFILATAALLVAVQRAVAFRYAPDSKIFARA